MKLKFVEHRVVVPTTVWEWAEECAPLRLNTMILIQRVPSGSYDRESLAAATRVPVNIVLSDQLTPLKEYGGKW